jgi:hypothetical protein
MALPKQVQAQLAEVEELEKSLTARNDKPKDAEEAETEDQADTEVVETEPETEEAAEPEDAAPADTSPTDVADDFRQKYNTLRGKYDAEVPRLHEQVRGLTSQVEELHRQLSQTQKSDEPTKPEEKVSYVTDADREEFGEELIDVQRRVAREVAAEYEQQLKSQAEVIEELRSQVAQTGNQVGEMSFAQRLNQLVPDFAQVDQDERWVAWLNEYDPMLRGPRRVQAKAAFDAGDAEAVAHYVSLFKESIADTKEPVADKRQAELEKQVAPNRSANTARTKSAGKDAKIYSEREVNGVWDKIRQLNTRGMFDEAAKLEADITAAYLEGRVKT